MKPTDKQYTTIHYQSYLALDKILNAQHLRSAEVAEEPAHEEMLFIIVHQSYEIWFKQIIHELESVIDMFDRHDVDEKNIGTSIARLNRVIVIFKLLVEHIPIMETMTPLDFLDFRKYLFPASGFQSFQFRKIENLLGLPEKERITYHGHHYAAFFSEEHKKELKKIASGNSLFRSSGRVAGAYALFAIGEIRLFGVLPKSSGEYDPQGRRGHSILSIFR
jgi:tryptophan 2,3-dioxygenase